LNCSGIQAQANPLSVAGVIASASAIKSMLSGLIDKASGEIQETLQQALNGITELENDLMKDLEGLENATMEDLDQITQDRLSEFNSMLESTLALILQLERDINMDLAIRVKSSIAEANETWVLISKDLDEKIIKTTKGICKVVDTATIQIIRIVVIICAFILVISAIFLLRKYKTQGYIALAIGSVFLIFSLTPWFGKAVTGIGLGADVLPNDGILPEPYILSTYPDALSFNYDQHGNASIYGVNFVSDSAPSKLLFGTSVSNLRSLNQSSINNTVIQFPCNSITNSSGTYYFQLNRGDGKKSQIINAYVSRPEEIQVKIEYTIWQVGQLRSYFATTDPFQVREVHRCGRLESNVQSYDGVWVCSAPDGGIIQDFLKDPINDRYLSDLNEYINSGIFHVDFNLSCKTFNRAGWYRADYYFSCFKDDIDYETIAMATSGVLVLYYDPETHRYNTSSCRIIDGIKLYQKAERIKFSSTQTTAQNVRTIALKIPGTLLQQEFRSAIYQGTTLPDLSGIILTNQEFKLGEAPDLPGFTPNQLKYDAVITSANVNEMVEHREESSVIRNRQGDIFMRLTIEGESLMARMIGAPN